MEDVFNDPRAETIQRSKEVIGSAVDLILTDDKAIRKLIEQTSHDYHMHSHSVNVCVFSIALAKGIFPNMSDDEFQRLGAGLTLYDVGKSRVPLEVLNKQSPLDDAEWHLIRTHSEESVRILEEAGHLTEESRIIALQHHEWLNGTGYPNKLKGDEIHEFAQICSIADAYDALTTNRVHQQSTSAYKALSIMKNEMDDHFAKEYFEAFVKMLSK